MLCHRPVCCVLTVTPTDLYLVSQTCMLCVIGPYVVPHLYAVCCVSSVSVTDLCVVCLRSVCCVSQACMLCHRPVCCVPTVTLTDLCCVSAITVTDLYVVCQLSHCQCHRLVSCVSTVTLSVSQTCILCVSDLYVVSQYLCHICHKPITVYVVSQTCRLCVTDLWVVCFVSQTEVQTAVQYWQDTLRVRATRAPIRLRRQCGSASVNYYKQRAYCVGQCAPVTVCGEIIIPQEHLEVSACVIVMLCKHLEVGV